MPGTTSKVTGEQTNGTAPAATPDLVPQEKIQVFGQELSALLQKYGVEIRPYTKMYNTGQQEAAFEFVLLPPVK